VRAAIEGSLQQLKTEPPRLVWVAPRGLHVTLRFFGEQPDERVAGLVAAVQQPYAVAPFAIQWHGLGAFPSPRRPRAIWMGVRQGARELGQLEVEVARRFGRLLPGEEPGHAEPFHPHLTLARVKTESKAARWPEILEAAVVGEVYSQVGHVALYRSRGLPGGEGYEEIGRGQLGG
jgi:2'-5' RNA ligase